MTKRIKTLLAGLTIAMFGLVPVVAPATVSAQNTIQDGLCAGAELNARGDCASVTTGDVNDSVNNIATTLINLFSLVVGIVAVIMIIVGGFKYITSGGDSNNVSSAKNTILFAIVGLIIVALAQFIVRYVLNKALEVA